MGVSRMVDLPKKKVGIVACSGEELPEGTVTRLAALRLLEQLRPSDTVTICLPLFLAGGEGDRAFARFYPTVAVDGCERRCAALATERYSGKPAASLVVSRLAEGAGLGPIEGRRKLNRAGQQVADLTAMRMAELVDELLEKRWNRRTGEFIEAQESPGSLSSPENPPPSAATCACGSGIPVQVVTIAGQAVTLIALPLIFKQFRQDGKAPSEVAMAEILNTVRVYNPIPEGADEAYLEALAREYALYWQAQEAHP
jgi:hypothetical protein